VEVLDPVAPDKRTADALATRPVLIPGARIGLLANGKPNADVLLRAINDRVAREFQALGPPIELNKGTDADGPGGPAPEEHYEILSSGAIAVLAASGD
jgi:hypothetical protein